MWRLLHSTLCAQRRKDTVLIINSPFISGKKKGGTIDLHTELGVPINPCDTQGRAFVFKGWPYMQGPREEEEVEEVEGVGGVEGVPEVEVEVENLLQDQSAQVKKSCPGV